jgi:hypothetical protein
MPTVVVGTERNENEQFFVLDRYAVSPAVNAFEDYSYITTINFSSD